MCACKCRCVCTCVCVQCVHECACVCVCEHECVMLIVMVVSVSLSLSLSLTLTHILTHIYTNVMSTRSGHRDEKCTKNILQCAPCSAINTDSSRLAGWLFQYITSTHYKKFLPPPPLLLSLSFSLSFPPSLGHYIVLF